MEMLRWVESSDGASYAPHDEALRESDAGEPPKRSALFAGKYTIERVLGRGGMGIVLGARHAKLEHAVAIKLLLPQALERKDARARFEREARAAASMRGDHVVHVHDLGVLDSGVPYIVMEYLEGRDFADVLDERGALPLEEAVDYVLQVCDALAEAHAAGIVHRDLKPANLFLAEREDGTTIVKVVDFGLSKFVGARPREATITDASLVVGSPGWMSPEQLCATHRVDERSDIWTTGALLYRMITGQSPFGVDSLDRMYTRLVSGPPPPPSKLRPGLPPEIDAVILKCLERDRERRYQTVAELALALADFAPARAWPLLERIPRVRRAAELARTATMRPPSSHAHAALRTSTTTRATRTSWMPFGRSRSTMLALLAIPLALVLGAGAARFPHAFEAARWRALFMPPPIAAPASSHAGSAPR